LAGDEARQKQGETTMKIKTNVKAGAACAGCTYYNHNETLAVRSSVKAGGIGLNHNESFRR
jgi:hypothetical protein